jgi:hypothetical protein
MYLVHTARLGLEHTQLPIGCISAGSWVYLVWYACHQSEEEISADEETLHHVVSLECRHRHVLSLVRRHLQRQYVALSLLSVRRGTPHALLLT